MVVFSDQQSVGVSVSEQKVDPKLRLFGDLARLAAVLNRYDGILRGFVEKGLGGLEEEFEDICVCSSKVVMQITQDQE